MNKKWKQFLLFYQYINYLFDSASLFNNYMNTDNKKKDRDSLALLEAREPEIKSFRLTTKKKFSLRSYTQQKSSHSISSDKSSFSSEYNLLTKKLKNSKCHRPISIKLNETVSSFGGLDSHRIMNLSKNQLKKMQTINPLLMSSLNFGKISKQLDSTLHRYSTNLNSQPKNIKLSSTISKGKKYFKIQKPSRLWEVSQPRELSLFKKQKQKIKQATKQKQQIMISQDNKKSRSKVLENCSLLWTIRRQITSNSVKIKPKQILKAIKNYIMRKEEKDTSNGMEKAFANIQYQNDYKELITCQRILLICLVDLINIEKMHMLCFECSNVMDNIFGLYSNILKKIGELQNKQDQKSQQSVKCKILLQQISNSKVEQKSSITSTFLFVCTKFDTIFRYSPDLYRSLKPVINNSKKVSINRSFYDILTIYSVYLNEDQLENISENVHIKKHMVSFLTCPSPFIVEPRNKKNYTLVLDLDETLLYSQFQTGSPTKFSVVYRPYCRQFVQKLSKFYQIVIFTSSVSTYANEVVSPFSKFISHMLYREHTIKHQGGTIKDLNRIGRTIESTIIVDNLSSNFKLQTQNGIQIKSWYGDKNDDELQKLQRILTELIQNNPKDLRQSLKKLCENQAFTK